MARQYVALMTRMGLAMVFRPKTRDWGNARLAIEDYIREQDDHNRAALGLDRAPAGDDTAPASRQAAE